MTKIMDGVTEYEEGMEVKLMYQKDRHTKKERYMVLAMNEAGHCCTRVDLIQLLDWVKINKPELINRPWVGLTNEEVDPIYEQHHNQYEERESVNWGYERAIEAKLKEKNT